MLNYRILAEVLSELLFNIITQPSKGYPTLQDLTTLQALAALQDLTTLQDLAALQAFGTSKWFCGLSILFLG